MSIEQKVKELIALEAGVGTERVTDDATLEDLGIDSLDRVELAMVLEDEFEIEIPVEHVEQFTTVRATVDYVAGRYVAGRKQHG